jgi:hypothetical protein
MKKIKPENFKIGDIFIQETDGITLYRLILNKKHDNNIDFFIFDDIFGFNNISLDSNKEYAVISNKTKVNKIKEKYRKRLLDNYKHCLQCISLFNKHKHLLDNGTQKIKKFKELETGDLFDSGFVLNVEKEMFLGYRVEFLYNNESLYHMIGELQTCSIISSKELFDDCDDSDDETEYNIFNGNIEKVKEFKELMVKVIELTHNNYTTLYNLTEIETE